MFLKRVKIDKGRRKRFKTFSVALLLFLYVAGNVQAESFHQFFHSLEKSLHSYEQEKDPCHRAIYHDSQKEGCEHKTHVTAVKKCPLCHIVPLNEQSVAVNYSFESFASQTDFNHFLFSFHRADAVDNLPSRAPPIS